MELQFNGGAYVPCSRLQLSIANPTLRFPSALCSVFTTVDNVSRRQQNKLFLSSSIPRFPASVVAGQADDFLRKYRLNASRRVDDASKTTADREDKGGGQGGESREQMDVFDMDDKERKDWRRKIREVISANPHVEEEEEDADDVGKRRRMEKLLADYPLVVDEDDPDWPDDAEGWGFSLDQFFNKVTIKNVKKEADDDDDDYDSENEIVWQDDDYIRPIKDIASAEWESTVFKDISPLVVLVHNRYRRPKENEKVRDALEKAVQIIWNCRLPSPRCVAIDAVVEEDLVSALQVSTFPELIFTNAGKILYREKGIRTPDELSKIMAFFYFKAAKPPCLSGFESTEELIPSYSQK